MFLMLLPASAVIFYIMYLHQTYLKYGMFVAFHLFARKACERAERYIMKAYSPNHFVTLPDSIWIRVGQKLEYEYTAPRVNYSKFRSTFKDDKYILFIVYCIVLNELTSKNGLRGEELFESLEILSDYLIKSRFVSKEDIESNFKEVFAIHKNVKPGLDYYRPRK